MQKSKDNIKKSEILKKVTPLINQSTEECGVLPLEIDFVKDSGKWHLRIYIYRKSPSIRHEDCEKLTKMLNESLDELIEIPYYLEVSSPGTERKLKSSDEYEIFKGEKVKVKLKKALDGDKKVFLANIIDFDKENGLILQEPDSEKTITIEEQNISSVKLEPDYNYKKEI